MGVLRRSIDWLRTRDLITLVGFLALTALLWTFLSLSDAVAGTSMVPAVDETILRGLRGEGGDPVGPDFLQTLLVDLTHLASGGVSGFLALCVVGYLVLDRRPRYAALVFVAAAGAWGLAGLLKGFFFRDRPEMISALVDRSGEGFPSGHALVAAALYPTLGVLLARVVQRKRLHVYVVSLGVFIALVVGFSRVYVGVHFPTDVLAGWAVGASWALTCGLVARLLARRGFVDASAGGTG